MHLIVSWKIEETSEKSTEIDDAMKQGLNGYPWIQPLSKFYILEIFSPVDWIVIQERLLSIAQNFPEEVNFIMSPIYHEETDYFAFRIPENNFYRRT